VWSGFSWIRIGTSADSCEHSDEPSGSGAIQLVKFLCVHVLQCGIYQDGTILAKTHLGISGAVVVLGVILCFNVSTLHISIISINGPFYVSPEKVVVLNSWTYETLE
jgi:hypothetical protein